MQHSQLALMSWPVEFRRVRCSVRPFCHKVFACVPPAVLSSCNSANLLSYTPWQGTSVSDKGFEVRNKDLKPPKEMTLVTISK